ncbi:MAG: hypothetical protein LBT79_07450 [Elusimicrobiota bacterium]|jgi:hypothetical protein|nr:hypothetical protein [Elusimicrobiota bacterium]
MDIFTQTNIDDFILYTAALITAGGVIIVFLSKCKNQIRCFLGLDEINKNILRLTLHDEHLPIRERILAGEDYIKLGGNGASAVFLDKLKEKYKDKVEV